MQVIPYSPQADPYSYLSQGLGNLFGGLQGQYMQGLLGQDIAGMQQPGYQPQHPLAQQMMLQMQDPMYQARLQAEKARTKYWSRPNLNTDRYLRAAEIKSAQLRQASSSEEKALIAGEVNELLQKALGSLNPEDKSPPTEKKRKRAEKVIEDVKKTITTPQGQPTAKPLQDETDVIGELTPRKKYEAPTEYLRTKEVPDVLFRKYPAPRTEGEFERTLSHIPTTEKKRLYFETMMRRIKDDKLAGKIYIKWGDILYR